MEVMSRMIRRSLLRKGMDIFTYSRYSSIPPNGTPSSNPPVNTPQETPTPDQTQVSEERKERLPRIGDDGTAVLLTGIIKPKDDAVFHAIGSTDELCSFIGLAREFAAESHHSYVEYLKRIQTLLIDISVAISNCNYNSQNSTPPRPTVTPSPLSTKGTHFSARHVVELEEWIDEYSKSLPSVEHFVVPGGGRACAILHVALSVCRRTERQVVPLVRDGDLNKEVLVYLNRLAEFLFIVSRVAAKEDEHSELVYTPTASSSTSTSK